MSMTLTKINALDAFIKGEKTAGRWDGIKRLYFPVWQLAAANVICMKSLTTGTFVGSIDHGSGYAKPNDSSSGMVTNSTLPDIGVTKESWHFATLIYELGEGDGAFWGRDLNTDFSAVADFANGEEGPEYMNCFFRVSNRTHSSNSTFPRLLSIFGTANTVSIKNRNSYSVASIYSSSSGGSTNTVDFVNGAFSVMSLQSAGSPALASQSKYGAFSFGNTLSDAQDTAYTLALKTLWETVTELTLP